MLSGSISGLNFASKLGCSNHCFRGMKVENNLKYRYLELGANNILSGDVYLALKYDFQFSIIFQNIIKSLNA